MPFIDIVWDMSGEEAGNVDHIADNGLTREDVRHAFDNVYRHTVSKSSGNPAIFGWTEAGELIFVTYERIDDETVYPVTAYRIER